MNRERCYKIALVLLLLVFLFVTINAAFALGARTGCCMDEPGSLCQSLAMLQETLRRFAGTLLAVTGVLALLLFLQLMADEFLLKRSPTSLISLKARLNN